MNDMLSIEDNNYILILDNSNIKLFKDRIFKYIKIENSSKFLNEIKDKNLYKFAFSPEEGVLTEYIDD